MQVDAVLVDHAEPGEAVCQLRTSNFYLAINIHFEPANGTLKISGNERGVWAN